MKECLVIGYGNTLRSDDGLGPYVVKSLTEKLENTGKNVRILSLHQLDISLSSTVSKSHIVIFVDARADDTSELVTVEKIKPAAIPLTPDSISHTINIPTLLRASIDLFGAAPQCYIVMPKGYDFSFGERISEKAIKSASLARKKIVKILQAFD